MLPFSTLHYMILLWITLLCGEISVLCCIFLLITCRVGALSDVMLACRGLWGDQPLARLWDQVLHFQDYMQSFWYLESLRSGHLSDLVPHCLRCLPVSTLEICGGYDGYDVPSADVQDYGWDQMGVKSCDLSHAAWSHPATVVICTGGLHSVAERGETVSGREESCNGWNAANCE